MQAESAKNNNQQNEIPKDYSLLRKFDLESAKRGELMCNAQGEGKFKLELYAMNANDYVVGIILEDSNGCCTHSKPSYLRMLPLCWIEGKPVYKGDVLWRVDNSTGNLQKFVVESIERYSKYSCNYLVSEDNLHIGLDFIYSTLHWEKPKVKVQKEGWMNIYHNDNHGFDVPCSNSPVYKTKEIADLRRSEHRIDCVKVHWEVEE